MRRQLLQIFFTLLFLFGCTSSTSPYKIGIDPTFSPLDLHGSEQIVLAFTTELLQEIAKKEKLNLSSVTVNRGSLDFGLKADKYDAMIASIVPYDFNLKNYDFSPLFLQTGPVIVAKKGSIIRELSDLKGKRVGLQTGSSYASLLDTTPELLIDYFDLIPQGLNELSKDGIDAMIIDRLSATIYIRDLYQNLLMIASQPLSQEGLRLITLKGKASHLQKKYAEGLKAMQEDGSLDALLRKWGLKSST